MKLVWRATAWDEYVAWRYHDLDDLDKINALLAEVMRTPFTGRGKPEPLKRDLSGWWSRRITREHRLVYRVTGSGQEQALEILQCRSHYES